MIPDVIIIETEWLALLPPALALAYRVGWGVGFARARKVVAPVFHDGGRK